MKNLWVRFEQRFGLVVTVGMEDDNTAGGWKLELVMAKSWIQIRAFQRDDSGGEYNYRQYYIIRNPSSEGSSGDSGHEDCSASGHPFLQMGECSTSDYHQEIPQDDPAQPDSGASGSQILPVKELSTSDDQASPWNSLPAGASIQMGESFASDYHHEIPKSDPGQLDSGASGSPSLPVAVHSGGDDDYLGSPKNAVSDDSSDDAWLKANEVLFPLPAGDSILMGEQFAFDYHQEIPTSYPAQQDSGVAWLEANEELSLSYDHASPSSSESSKDSFACWCFELCKKIWQSMKQ